MDDPAVHSYLAEMIVFLMTILGGTSVGAYILNFVASRRAQIGTGLAVTRAVLNGLALNQEKETK